VKNILKNKNDVKGFDTAPLSKSSPGLIEGFASCPYQTKEAFMQKDDIMKGIQKLGNMFVAKY